MRIDLPQDAKPEAPSHSWYSNSPKKIGVELVRDTSCPRPYLNNKLITTTKNMVNTTLPSSNCSLLNAPTSQTMPNKCCWKTLHSYSARELGKWAFNQSKLLASLGWRNFFHYHLHPHSVQPSISNISHPKAQYLHYLACSGAPAFFPNTDWSAHALTRYISVALTSP